MALIKAKVDDPLVCWLTGRAAWNDYEGVTEARDCVSKAFRHPKLRDYPSMLILYLNDLREETRRKNKTPESVVAVNAERRRQVMKSAAAPAVFGPEDDRLLYSEVEFIFDTLDLSAGSLEAAEVEGFCDTPHFTPWLHEMLHGKLSSGRSSSGEPKTTARAHFLKAWELRPDRAAAAAAMIEIVKSGNGPAGHTARQWFDRAIAVEFDCLPAYSSYISTLRSRAGGGKGKIQAFYCACVLTGRIEDTAVAAAIERLTHDLATEAADVRTVISKEPMKQVVVHTCRTLAESKNVYRMWEHPWRFADLGLMAWVVGDYETAYATLQQVPAPFPRQTRRKLPQLNDSNESNVRSESALFAAGLQPEWEAAEEMYQSRQVAEATQQYQDLVARFQGEPPGLLLERVAACKFETAFATGKWVPIWANPDLAEWHRCSGTWTGLKSGTLVNDGMDAQAFILHNGRTGTNFELMGEYEVKNLDDVPQGLSIILGYRTLPQTENYHWEDFICCSQWQNPSTYAIATMLRMISQSTAPQVVPPVNGSIWKFHIICRNGAVTFRLNHRDIAINQHVTNDLGTFEMSEDSCIGICHFFLDAKSHTHIRRLKIRRLEPPAEAGPQPEKPATLAALRTGFQAASQNTVADLNAAALLEAEALADDLTREHKDAEAGKIRAIIARLSTGEAIKAADMPMPAAGEDILATLLRGYLGSLDARLASARAEWKTMASALCDESPNSQEAANVRLFANAELSEHPDDQPEEPLAQNDLKWTQIAGEWTRTADLLSAPGHCIMSYEFNRKPPFRIDFDLRILDSRRLRLKFGGVRFGNETVRPTLGLFPQPGTAQLFTYETGRLYHITLKAEREKTELLIDNVHVCDGTKAEANVSVLLFLSGEGSSKGKTEFHKIRISPLP